MSDNIPNPPPNPDRDPNNYRRYMDADRKGRGLTLIVGILVAIALAAGLVFFAKPSSERLEQAQLPAGTPATERTATVPSPATPATPAAPTPAPANEPQR